METLSTELLFQVLAYATVSDIAVFARANRATHAVAMASLFPRALIHDQALHADLAPYDVHRQAVDDKTRLPYMLRIVESGNLDNIGRLIAAGSRLGHFRVPYCKHDAIWSRSGNCKHSSWLWSIKTPLHVAAAADDIPTIRYLLSHNVPVDVMAFRSCLCPSRHVDMLTHPDCHGWSTRSEMPAATPLHSAIAHNVSDDVILLLIGQGAVWDLPLVHSHGVTALHMMAANGRTSLLNKMAARGLSGRDWPDHLGYRTLHYAACCPAANVEMASELVEALIRVGATLHDSRQSWQHHYSPARRLVNGFRQAAYTTGATRAVLSPSLPQHGAWMDTDWMLPSGALVDIDEGVFSELPLAPPLLDHAIARGNKALSSALQALLREPSHDMS